MADTSKLSTFLAIFLALNMASISQARVLDNPHKLSLVARLKMDASSPSCWESLVQIQACTGEVVMFFLNGETYLGEACCRAIDNIAHQCWPDMLETLGYTTEEGDILQAYCDHETDHNNKSPPSETTEVVPVKAVQLIP